MRPSAHGKHQTVIVVNGFFRFSTFRSEDLYVECRDPGFYVRNDKPLGDGGAHRPRTFPRLNVDLAATTMPNLASPMMTRPRLQVDAYGRIQRALSGKSAISGLISAE